MAGPSALPADGGGRSLFLRNGDGRSSRTTDGEGARGFWFRHDGDRLTGDVATSLAEFHNEISRIDAHVLRHHAAGGDFSRWIDAVYGDHELADGTNDDLANLRAGSVGTAWPREWMDAIGFLAGEIMILIDDDPDLLGALQRDVLVPMELRLASDWLTPMTPAELVQRVRRELPSRT